MRRIAIEQNSTPEVVVKITWRQWEDGSRAAWLVAPSDPSPRLVRNRAELEEFLKKAPRRWSPGPGSGSGGSRPGGALP
jgi:hypothetical protein